MRISVFVLAVMLWQTVTVADQQWRNRALALFGMAVHTSGRIGPGPAPAPTDKCQTCNGTGKWMKDGVPQGTCPTCNGTGKRTTAETPEAACPPVVPPPTELPRQPAEPPEASPPVSPVSPEAELFPAPPAVAEDIEVVPAPTETPAVKPTLSRSDFYVNFWTGDWCTYCRTFERQYLPQLKAAGIDVREINFDMSRAAALALGFTGPPDFQVVRKSTGAVVQTFKGLTSAAKILGAIDAAVRGDKPVNAVMPRSTSPPVSPQQFSSPRQVQPPQQFQRQQYRRRTNLRWHLNGIYYDKVWQQGDPAAIEQGRRTLLAHLRSTHAAATQTLPLESMSLIELFDVHCDTHSHLLQPYQGYMAPELQKLLNSDKTLWFSHESGPPIQLEGDTAMLVGYNLAAHGKVGSPNNQAPWRNPGGFDSVADEIYVETGFYLPKSVEVWRQPITIPPYLEFVPKEQQKDHLPRDYWRWAGEYPVGTIGAEFVYWDGSLSTIRCRYLTDHGWEGVGVTKGRVPPEYVEPKNCVDCHSDIGRAANDIDQFQEWYTTVRGLQQHGFFNDPVHYRDAALPLEERHKWRSHLVTFIAQEDS